MESSGKDEEAIIDLGLSLTTLQPQAFRPSGHEVISVSCLEEGYNQLVSWAPAQPQHHGDGGDEEAEGRLRWAYVKVSMEGVMVGRKVCMLHHAGYSALACQLEEMFGRHTSTGLRLFEVESEFALFYKDIDDIWRNVGDVPWKEFVERVKRLRISPKSQLN